MLKRRRREAVLPKIVHRDSPNQSSRHGARVHLFVVHSTEGHYKGDVSWLCNPSAQASAHIVLREDGEEATQLVPWERKAWTQAAFNPVAESLELCGRRIAFDEEFEALRHKPGRLPKKQIRVAARIVAFRLRKRGLPPKWSRHGKTPGFCRHLDLGAAGGGHRDPFGTFGWWKFIARVKYEYRRGGFRQSWGREE